MIFPFVLDCHQTWNRTELRNILSVMNPHILILLCTLHFVLMTLITESSAAVLYLREDSLSISSCTSICNRSYKSCISEAFNAPIDCTKEFSWCIPKCMSQVQKRISWKKRGCQSACWGTYKQCSSLLKSDAGHQMCLDSRDECVLGCG